MKRESALSSCAPPPHVSCSHVDSCSRARARSRPETGVRCGRGGSGQRSRVLLQEAALLVTCCIVYSLHLVLCVMRPMVGVLLLLARLVRRNVFYYPHKSRRLYYELAWLPVAASTRMNPVSWLAAREPAISRYAAARVPVPASHHNASLAEISAASGPCLCTPA